MLFLYETAKLALSRCLVVRLSYICVVDMRLCPTLRITPSMGQLFFKAWVMNVARAVCGVTPWGSVLQFSHTA